MKIIGTVLRVIGMICVPLAPFAFFLLAAAAPEPAQMVGMTYFPAEPDPPLWFTLPCFAVIFIGVGYFLYDQDAEEEGRRARKREKKRLKKLRREHGDDTDL